MVLLKAYCCTGMSHPSRGEVRVVLGVGWWWVILNYGLLDCFGLGVGRG